MLFNRLWFGTANGQWKENWGSLYRVDEKGCTQMTYKVYFWPTKTKF